MENQLLSVPETGYEMKCFVKDTVLNQSHKLDSKIRELFNITEGSELKMNVMYLDNTDLKLNKAGWTIRVRKKDTSSKFEYTYKKRYSDVQDATDILYSTLTDGFVSLNSEYEVETDCTRERKTLSFSNETKAAISGISGVEFPPVETSINNAIKYAPVELAGLIPTELHGFGTVLAERYVGSMGDIKITIEVWPILNEDKTGYEYVIEASFKTTDGVLAFEKQKELEAILRKEEILLDTDILKTQLVLSRY